MHGPEPILEIAGVTKSYSGVRALHDVSFTVQRGTIHGLIGPNGAGKSTLFGVIAGAIRADSGDVSFEGRPLGDILPAQVAARGIARTFQNTRPFASLSVLDNIAVAGLSVHRSMAAARRAAQEVAHDVGLEEWARRRASDVPAGVLRRLELARALAISPRLMLLDEIFAGLSAVERQPIIDLLVRLREQGMTIVLVDHVLDALMSLSDRVLCLDHGVVMTEGTPQEVSTHPDVIEAYLGGTP
jgi:branched-chain amino acid transport system ATP-binding protein